MIRIFLAGIFVWKNAIVLAPTIVSLHCTTKIMYFIAFALKVEQGNPQRRER
jgi:hypothetical protein